MERLSSYRIYVLIAVLAVLVFLRLGMVERDAYAALAVSPGISTAPVVDGWYGLDQISGQVSVPRPWANVLGDGPDSDDTTSPADVLTGDRAGAASVTGSSSAAAAIVSDDFHACDLDTDLWTFIRPVSGTYFMTGSLTADAWLAISVPFGISHDVWSSGNRAPRVMQPADDTDFEIEVKFESGVGLRYQVQGVIVEQDSDDFLRFDFHSDGSSTRIFAASFTDGTPLQRVSSIIAVRNAAPLYMRVGRQGDEWTQSYSFDGASWTTSVTFTHALTVTAVGTFAGNAGSTPPAHTGYIDYFFNTASRIVPEDEARNALTVNVVGNGSAIPDPVKSNYDCGEVVTLTATAGTGWTFAGWSGGLTGSDNPAAVTMTGPRAITATFTSEEYTLTVNTVGKGRVDKDPDQTTYYYGEEVTLTATADPGWTFAGWSGALSGTDNPETITIIDDATVTATFTQDEYTLTVNTVGNGSVTVAPPQTTYHYGDEVTLTAVGDPGWVFAGWSGDLSGADNPETITITGDTTVTASFIEGVYTLTVNVVGNGSVTVDPEQTTYRYGDVVVLTATAASDWIFAGWSGDWTSANNPETITIADSMTIIATFHTRIFLPLVIRASTSSHTSAVGGAAAPIIGSYYRW